MDTRLFRGGIAWTRGKFTPAWRRPALALPSNMAAAVYLILFGIGSIAAMGAFSSLIGWIASRSGANHARTQSTLLALFSGIAIAVGGVWLFVEI